MFWSNNAVNVTLIDELQSRAVVFLCVEYHSEHPAPTGCFALKPYSELSAQVSFALDPKVVRASFDPEAAGPKGT